MEHSPSINIDGITFRLLNKYTQNGYLIVNLISNEIDFFSCYRSNSELGMWRLCSKSLDNKLYKGSDYVQTTLIHILLQIFINNHINKIPEEYNPTFANCILKNPEYKEIIDDPERIVKIEPFNSFHRHLECGQTLYKTHSYKTILEDFSKIIPKYFYFNVDTFLPLSNYSYI